jgi:GT2 family glycosyltransferase
METQTVNFLILVRAMWWLFVGPHRRKLAKVWATYKFGGIKLCWHRAVERFGTSQRDFPYDATRNQLSPKQSEYVLAKCLNKPLISIITPVYKVNSKWLDKCIKSVVVQHYDNWELILVDDGSQKDDLKQLMDAWSLKDEQIRAFYLEKNCGIAGATNFGIKQARGKFVGFLDHDDELTPDTLTWVVWTLNKHPNTLWLYSDEDLISHREKCHSPHFKPDFSPELLLSNMFTCHFSVYSTDILSKVGGIREGFEGSQDHDLALRISEIVRGDQVIHIPRVLYHRRTILGPAATNIEEKTCAPISGRKAVEEALKRRNLKGYVTSNKLCPTLYQITLQPTSFPKVNIIIPTKNSLSLIKNCLNSLRKHTSYPNYEIVIIDNQSDDKSFLKYIQQEQSKGLFKIIKYDKAYNHSEMNNMAVKSVDSDLVVFMNNDVEIISDNWLEQLVATINIIDESIASIGCLLLYADGKVQHGGIVLGLNGVAGHAHKFLDKQSSGYFGRLHCLQEITGVTAALSLVRKKAFEDVGGFNSDRYPTSFNDVDLSIRLSKKGYRCLYNPMVQAIHHESKTRPITAEELIYQKRLVDDYLEILRNDPFYNPNLALDNEQFRGFRPFPVKQQILELRNIPKAKSYKNKKCLRSV